MWTALLLPIGCWQPVTLQLPGAELGEAWAGKEQITLLNWEQKPLEPSGERRGCGVLAAVAGAELCWVLLLWAGSRGLAPPQRDLQQRGGLLHDAHQQLVDVVLQFVDVLLLLAQLPLLLQQQLDQLVVGQVVILG